MLSQLSKLTGFSTTFCRSLPVKKHSLVPTMNFSVQALKVNHEPTKSRFVIYHEDFEAKIFYKMKGQTIHFTYTGVPKEMEGRGVGKLLAKVCNDLSFKLFICIENLFLSGSPPVCQR